jgi:hypothetical protein
MYCLCYCVHLGFTFSGKRVAAAGSIRVVLCIEDDIETSLG